MSKAISLENLQVFKEECDNKYALKSDIPSTDELLGTWVFKFDNSYGITPNTISGNINYNINFTSNNKQYNLLQLQNYKNMAIYVNYDTTLSCDDGLGWQNEAYKTIKITDTSSLTNREEFTTWLKANATKQGESGGGGNNGYTLTIDNSLSTYMNVYILKNDNTYFLQRVETDENISIENVKAFVHVYPADDVNITVGNCISYDGFYGRLTTNYNVYKKTCYLIEDVKLTGDSGGGAQP